MSVARLAVLVALSLVAACDLKPAPAKQKEAPAVAPPPVAPQPPPLPPQLPAGSGADDAPAKEVTADFVTHDCLDAAAHVIDLTLAGITDPKEQVIQGRKRALMTRRTAEDCSKRPWKPDTIRCFATADSIAKMRDCDKLLD